MQINLLPWREIQEQKRRTLQRLNWVISIVLGFCLLYFINNWVLKKVSNQISRNQRLEQEIQAYVLQIKKIKNLQHREKRLISRIALMQHLQSGRSFMVRLLDELAKVTPQGVFLTKILGKNNLISVSGFAQSNASISQALGNMAHNNWFYHPHLNEVKSKEGANQITANEFKVTFTFKPNKLELPYEQKKLGI